MIIIISTIAGIRVASIKTLNTVVMCDLNSSKRSTLKKLRDNNTASTADSKILPITMSILIFLLMLLNFEILALEQTASAKDIASVETISPSHISKLCKVSNVCSDVVGDIFGIVSGACAAAITLKVVTDIAQDWQQKLITISISGVVSALTIGGKAFLKNIAIKNSKEFIMFIARLIAVFNPEERRRRKTQKEKQKKHDENKEKDKEVKG